MIRREHWRNVAARNVGHGGGVRVYKWFSCPELKNNEWNPTRHCRILYPARDSTRHVWHDLLMLTRYIIQAAMC